MCGGRPALGHRLSGIALCLTIIAIPLGIANLKLVPLAFLPLGREIARVEDAERIGPAPP